MWFANSCPQPVTCVFIHLTVSLRERPLLLPRISRFLTVFLLRIALRCGLRGLLYPGHKIFSKASSPKLYGLHFTFESPVHPGLTSTSGVKCESRLTFSVSGDPISPHLLLQDYSFPLNGLCAIVGGELATSVYF